MLIMYHFDLVLTLTILVQQGLLSSAVPNRVVKTHRARVTPEDATESLLQFAWSMLCMYVRTPSTATAAPFFQVGNAQ